MVIKKRSFIRRTGVFGFFYLFGLAPKVQAQTSVIYLDDYGLKLGKASADECFASAVRAARSLTRPTIVLPSRTIEFSQLEGVCITLAGLKDLTIRGENTRLVFSGRSSAFLIKSCRGISLQGVAFEWSEPPFWHGQVIATDGRSVRFRVDPQYAHYSAPQSIVSITEIDSDSMLPIPGGIDVGSVVASFASGASGIVDLTLSENVPLIVGITLVMKFSVGPPMVEFQDCEDVQLHLLSVNSCPGMAFVASNCNGIQARAICVEPSNGRPLSSNADVIHFSECCGDIEIDNLRVIRAGDDGINIHSNFYEVLASSNNEAVVRTRSIDQFLPTDTVTVRTPDTLKPVETQVVGSVLRAVGSETLTGISASPGNLVEVAKRRIAISITNSSFSGGRSRGILVHANAVIENCQFNDLGREGVLLSVLTIDGELPHGRDQITEGTVIRDIRIKHCRFLDCSLMAGGGALSVYALSDSLHGRTRYSGPALFENITVEGNSFESRSASLLVSSTRNVTVRGNRFVTPPGAAAKFVDVQDADVQLNVLNPGCYMVIQHCTNVTVSSPVRPE